ncbi:hypothetical protein QUF90_24185 [Desulfococcaceae bacterium HSG9]|nr:hypothetical protein [Desulfococcaceae bacterium HSG9]
MKSAAQVIHIKKNRMMPGAEQPVRRPKKGQKNITAAERNDII